MRPTTESAGILFASLAVSFAFARPTSGGHWPRAGCQRGALNARARAPRKQTQRSSSRLRAAFVRDSIELVADAAGQYAAILWPAR